MQIIKKPDSGIFDKRFPFQLKRAEIYDPTKFTILTGTDGILDDLFSYQVFNWLKNNWYAGAAPADMQDGMMWVDSGDGKLHLRHGAALEEVLQLTRSSDVSPTFANLTLAEYIYHSGDLDTYVRFQTDHMTLRVGGIDFINMVEAATDYLQLLDGLNFIGDNANAKMTVGLTINQAGNDDEILALKSSDVAHGVTDYAETDTYGFIQKASADIGGIAIFGFTEDEGAITLTGYYTNDDTGKDVNAHAVFRMTAYKKSGTGRGNMGANANILALRGYRGGSAESVWIVDEDGDTWQDGNIDLQGDKYIKGSTRLKLLAGASGVCSSTIFTDTTGSAENLHIGNDPYQIQLVVSSKKFKDKIKKLELDSALIQKLRPISFNSLCKNDDKARRFHGLIAEEIEQVFPEIINYDDNNEARGYDGRMLVTLMLAEVQNQRIEIEALKAQLNN